MYQIGFDVGGTNLKVGAVNDEKEIVVRRNVAFPKGETYQNIASLMADEVKELAGELNISVSEFKSIGVATAGSIAPEGSIILHAHNLGFHNVPMVDEMHRYFPGMPVFLANDADAAALAELHAGAFRGKKTAVLFTLGTGVGGGLILGGKMFKGGMGRGNELGHMIIQDEGPICTCGNKGCIESLCTATWLIRQGRKGYCRISRQPDLRNGRGRYESCYGKDSDRQRTGRRLHCAGYFQHLYRSFEFCYCIDRSAARPGGGRSWRRCQPRRRFSFQSFERKGEAEIIL